MHATMRCCCKECAISSHIQGSQIGGPETVANVKLLQIWNCCKKIRCCPWADSTTAVFIKINWFYTLNRHLLLENMGYLGCVHLWIELSTISERAVRVQNDLLFLGGPRVDTCIVLWDSENRRTCRVQSYSTRVLVCNLDRVVCRFLAVLVKLSRYLLLVW